MDPDVTDLLRDSFARYAAQSYGFEQRRAWLAGPDGYSRQAWADFAEFGWLAMRLPEDAGGVDADIGVLADLMRKVGGQLMLEPVLPTALATGLLRRDASAGQRERWLPALSEGRRIAAVALPGTAASLHEREGRLSGTLDLVLHGPAADEIYLPAPDGARLLRIDTGAPGYTRTAYRLVDGRPAAKLCLDDCPAEAVGDDTKALGRLGDEAAVLLCAELDGVSQALITQTLDYLKIRKQFGRPIGSNQALQHRATEIFALGEEITALSHTAAAALDDPARNHRIAGALAYASRAAQHIANEAVQMHGGIGITEELPVSHYFRRVMVCSNLLGAPDGHMQRYNEAVQARGD